MSGPRFLVTGGTGSFGQTMVRRLLKAGAAEVRVFSRDEAKQDAMRNQLRDGRVRYYIGDIRNADSLMRACRDVDFVFHARNNPQARTNILRAVRQRHVLPRLGHPAVRRADQGRPAADGHRFHDDPVRHVPGGLGRPGRTRLRQGPAGDIFIRKAQACTVLDLATAVCNLFGVPAKIEVIGVRHGEKMYEILASREELA
jgi:FlaA1/EpsC-like NDP-sugar epimerase